VELDDGEGAVIECADEGQRNRMVAAGKRGDAAAGANEGRGLRDAAEVLLHLDRTDVHVAGVDHGDAAEDALTALRVYPAFVSIDRLQAHGGLAQGERAEAGRGAGVGRLGAR